MCVYMNVRVSLARVLARRIINAKEDEKCKNARVRRKQLSYQFTDPVCVCVDFQACNNWRKTGELKRWLVMTDVYRRATLVCVCVCTRACVMI